MFVLRNRIHELKDQHRETIEQVVNLYCHYMELESDMWQWEDLDFDDFAGIPMALLDIFEDLRPPNDS